MSTINQDNGEKTISQIIEEAIDKAIATPDEKSKKFYEELLQFIEADPFHKPDAKELAAELNKTTGSSSTDSETIGGKSK